MQYPESALFLLLVLVSVVSLTCLGITSVLLWIVIKLRKQFNQQDKPPKLEPANSIQETASSSITVPSNLTVSDWVTFLSAEKFGLSGVFLNVGGIVLAAVTLIYSVGTANLWISVADGAVALGLAIYYLKKSSKIVKRSTAAAQLLDEITRKQHPDAESIHQAWEKRIIAPPEEESKKQSPLKQEQSYD